MNLNSLLKENSLTQQEFAKKLNITQQAVSYYVSGKRLPKLDLIDKMSEILNVSKELLIDALLNKKNQHQTSAKTSC